MPTLPSLSSKMLSPMHLSSYTSLPPFPPSSKPTLPTTRFPASSRNRSPRLPPPGRLPLPHHAACGAELRHLRQELLAVVDCFRSWRSYLEGAAQTTVVLSTTTLSSTSLLPSSCTRRQAAGLSFSSGFDYVIRIALESSPGSLMP